MMQHAESILTGKIKALPQLLSDVQQWKQNGKKVVFTNGCFDLIHIGHLTYLAKAAELGDKLIIGLNSDESVRILKGENRPINAQDSRAALLASMFFIDAVVIFGEETPADLIKAILPNVLVKGGDYTFDNIVGASEVVASGGEVKTITFVEGHSSTAIINKIKGQTS